MTKSFGWKRYCTFLIINDDSRSKTGLHSRQEELRYQTFLPALKITSKASQQLNVIKLSTAWMHKKQLKRMTTCARCSSGSIDQGKKEGQTAGLDLNYVWARTRSTRQCCQRCTQRWERWVGGSWRGCPLLPPGAPATSVAPLLITSVQAQLFDPLRTPYWHLLLISED